jgi:hypothetical protein
MHEPTKLLRTKICPGASKSLHDLREKIPLGANARNILAKLMYGLKPVPFTGENLSGN